MAREPSLWVLAIAALVTATAAVGVAANDPWEVAAAEGKLGSGGVGLVEGVVAMFALEVQVIQAIGGQHPSASAFPTELDLRARARREVDAFFASREVPAGLRETVRAACAGTDPHDARTCQRAGHAALEAVRVRRETARAWFERVAWASVPPWGAGLVMLAMMVRRRRRAAAERARTTP